ncbi:hypothetical protein ES708_33956 [subsurface metagenome]
MIREKVKLMANPTGIGGFQTGEKSKGGRPFGSKNLFNKDSRKAILTALSIVEKDKSISGGKSFWLHIASRAYRSDMVAIAVLKKLCPDLAAVEYDLAKGGRIKKIKFEIVGNKPDSGDVSTQKTLEEN